ncbi:MAG: copper amine oxidase N-terminal domain-containing protein [Clostridia bacterium]|nr:copper amine oxidase N-terminal domain-containing protein [Clostridia bacterium]
MNKRVKIIAISLLLTFIWSLFTGCAAADQMTLLNALEKSMSIRSMESDSDVTLKFNITGLPKDEQGAVNEFLAAIGNIRILSNQKLNQNQDRTKSDSEIDATIQAGGVSFNTSLWNFSDFSGEKPLLNQIVKLPSILTSKLGPAFSGKEYMVMDEAMLGTDGTSATDYKKVIEAVNRFQPKLLNFMKEFAKEMDPKHVYVKKVGEKEIKGEQVSVFELRLNDASLRSLVKYVLTNFAQNEQSKEFLKDFILLMAQLSGDEEIEEGIDEALDELRDGSANFKQDFKKVRDAFKDVKFLGNRGVVVNFSVNDEGYIVNQNGVIDLILDTKAIVKAAEKLDDQKNTAVLPGEVLPTLTLQMDFDVNMHHFNEDIDITSPEITEENSFKFSDLVNLNAPQIVEEDEMLEEPVSLVMGDKILDLDTHPVKVDEMVLVPVREISKEVGAKVRWSKNGEFEVLKDDIKVKYKTGSIDVDVNGEQRVLEYPATVMEGKAFVPAGFFGESLGIDIEFDEDTNSVIIGNEL